MVHFPLMCVFMNVSRYILMGKVIHTFNVYTYIIKCYNKIYFNFMPFLFPMSLHFFYIFCFTAITICFKIFSHSIPSTVLPKTFNAQNFVLFCFSQSRKWQVGIVDKLFDELKALYKTIHDSKFEERCFCSISVLLYFMLLLHHHHPLSLCML